MNYENFPEELKQLKQWVCFRKTQRKDKKTGEPLYNADGTIKYSKEPVNPHTGRNGSTTDPKKWADFETACAACDRYGLAGVGFVFTDNGIVGIDLDHVIDPETGEIDPKAHEIINNFHNTYIERSPSKTGFHIYGYGKKPSGKNRKTQPNGAEFEIYDTGRFFTVTGWHENGVAFELSKCQEEIDEFHRTYIDSTQKTYKALGNPSRPNLSDEQILTAAAAGRYKGLFVKLFKDGDTAAYSFDASAADQALCNIFAYYTVDPEQIERLFTAGALGQREKWLSREDYRKRTIDKAVRSKMAGKFLTIPVIHPEEYTDVRTAQAFVQAMGGTVAYCNEFKRWIFWDGKKWVTDEEKGIYGLFHDFILNNEIDLIFQLKHENERLEMLLSFLENHEIKAITKSGLKKGLKEIDPKRKDAIEEQQQQISAVQKQIKDCKKYENDGRIKGTLNQATPYCTVRAESLDKDPLLLNTPGGIWNMETGELLDHDPAYFCTKITAEGGGENVETWKDFISFVTANREDYADYLQVLCGSILIGKPYEEGIYIAHGTGGNGKSTFFNTIHRIMGTYSTIIKADIYTQESTQNKDPEIAKLQGVRLALSSELPNDSTFDIAILKRICSTDPVPAKALYKDPFEFEPSHTPVLLCNDMPKIPMKSLSDDATIDRIHVLPFEGENLRHTEEEVKDYSQVLIEQSGAAILKWMIDGAGLFLVNGKKLNPVLDFMDDYQNEQLALNDSVGRFLKAATVKEPTAAVPNADLYEAYIKFCKDNRLDPFTKGQFNRVLLSRGYYCKQISSGPNKKRRGYHGLKLNPEYMGELEA